MKCQSCGCEVPPAFVHAIKMNVCAGCGGPIMDENTVELMKGLAEAMEKMEHDPQGIAGWLLSNYRLEKVGDGEPTGFYKKQSVVAGVGYSDEKQKRLEQFFRNAQAPKTVGKTKKELQAELDAAASEPIEDIIDDTQYANSINSFISDDSSSFNEPAMPEEYADVDMGAHPALIALQQKQLQKTIEARNNINSGVRLNTNGFSRS